MTSTAGLSSPGTGSFERVLVMDEYERRDRMRALGHRVHEADLSEWLDDVLATASEIYAERGCA